MRTLFNNCSTGQATDIPDMIVTTQTAYELYEDETLEQKQIVNAKTGDASWTDPMITFKGVPVVWSSQCASGRMYFLNSKYFGLNVDPDINMTATEWKTINESGVVSKSTLIKGKNLPDGYDAVAEAEAILKNRE